MVSGLRLILWGLFKKVVIADRLAIYVDEVYSHPGSYEGFPLILATYFFAFQIYCDFSGYSDIAIGTARLFGFRLMRNFAYPYFSRNIAEFWRRWHISLSTWFRDYVYIPLGGNRKGAGRTYAAMVFTMLISGLWHGASWTFVIWGALHALGRAAGPRRDDRRRAAHPGPDRGGRRRGVRCGRQHRPHRAAVSISGDVL